MAVLEPREAVDEAGALTTGLTEEAVRRIVSEEIERAFKKDPGRKRAVLVASKGTLDFAYPPLIIASAAAALGMETSIFFTFYGLNILTKDFERRLQVGTVGNPAMPMPVPMPQLVTALPGMTPMATALMKRKFDKKGVATIGQLLDTCAESGVRLIACRMTMDVFGYAESDFRDGVEFGGAAAMLSDARKAHVTMFI